MGLPRMTAAQAFKMSKTEMLLHVRELESEMERFRELEKEIEAWWTFAKENNLFLIKSDGKVEVYQVPDAPPLLEAQTKIMRAIINKGDDHAATRNADQAQVPCDADSE